MMVRDNKRVMWRWGECYVVTGATPALGLGMDWSSQPYTDCGIEFVSDHFTKRGGCNYRYGEGVAGQLRIILPFQLVDHREFNASPART